MATVKNGGILAITIALLPIVFPLMPVRVLFKISLTKTKQCVCLVIHVKTMQ